MAKAGRHTTCAGCRQYEAQSVRQITLLNGLCDELEQKQERIEALQDALFRTRLALGHPRATLTLVPHAARGEGA